MWKEGTLKIYNSVFHYWIKVYETPSRYGVDGGKISKLMITREDMIVCNYDRGLDVKPKDPDTQLALEILLHGNNH